MVAMGVDDSLQSMTGFLRGFWERRSIAAVGNEGDEKACRRDELETTAMLGVFRKGAERQSRR
jgi:hypothetical protein